MADLLAIVGLAVERHISGGAGGRGALGRVVELDAGAHVPDQIRGEALGRTRRERPHFSIEEGLPQRVEACVPSICQRLEGTGDVEALRNGQIDSPLVMPAQNLVKRVGSRVLLGMARLAGDKPIVEPVESIQGRVCGEPRGRLVQHTGHGIARSGLFIAAQNLPQLAHRPASLFFIPGTGSDKSQGADLPGAARCGPVVAPYPQRPGPTGKIAPSRHTCKTLEAPAVISEVGLALRRESMIRMHRQVVRIRIDRLHEGFQGVATRFRSPDAFRYHMMDKVLCGGDLGPQAFGLEAPRRMRCVREGPSQ